MPLLVTVIMQVLSHRADSACNERICSIAKLVINDFRTSLTPERSERLSLSVCRYKMSQSSKLKRPKLTTNPGEPFEKITNEMDDIMETVLSTGEEAVMSSSSGKSADELAN